MICLIFIVIGLLIFFLYADQNTSFYVHKDIAEKNTINFLIISWSVFLLIALLASLLISLLVTNNSFFSILAAVGLLALASVTWYFNKKRIRIGKVKWGFIYYLRGDDQAYDNYPNSNFD
ncbi:MAG: hypothetical protein ACFCU7_07635 [Pleurocapsa sp.]